MPRSFPRRALPLAFGALLLLATAVPAAAGGQTIIPNSSLNPPPPAYETCVVTGDHVICNGTDQFTDGPDAPSGIVCGSAADPVELVVNDIGWNHAMRWYDSNLNWTRREIVEHITGTITNPRNGLSAQTLQEFPRRTTLAVPGDPSTAIDAFGGMTRFWLPGGGVQEMQAGRGVYDANGDVLHESGRLDFNRYFADGDASAMAPICAALAAPMTP